VCIDKTYFLHHVLVLIIVLPVMLRHDLHIRDAPRLSSAAAVVLKIVSVRRSYVRDLSTADANSEVVRACDATIASEERASNVGLADLDGDDVVEAGKLLDWWSTTQRGGMYRGRHEAAFFVSKMNFLVPVKLDAV
jgi:hypothetical protein